LQSLLYSLYSVFEWTHPLLGFN